MSEAKYKKAARIIIKAGMVPFPITDTLIDIMKLLYTDEEIDFIIKTFKKSPSLTLEEIKEITKLPEDKIKKNLKSLADKGAMFDQPSSSGVMVYRLLPLIMVGIFEYQYMKPLEYTEEEKKVAKLFVNLFEEVGDFIQEQYDTFLPFYRKMPPIDRTMPILTDAEGKEITVDVDKEVAVPEEEVLGTQSIERLIEKFDDIAVGHCFCRHHQDLLGNPCETTDIRENCFTFGKSARFVVDHGFARKVSKEEALDIMKKSEEAGLVHKAYHPHGNEARDETSLCNCCKCCCATFDLWRSGVMAMINSTNFLAKTNQELCVGCGLCVEKCPVDAIELNEDNKAERNENWCIGCGICAHFCPESAITLVEGKRKVFVPPPKLKT
ncbi:MAG: hypothetical protein GF383_13535 [Candidatus Lokiarchaeota archaeon]|nr:hypothetical protein [Candidatus Lokiarchaeota archaeon]MBD3342232.1 hypothetical protein [Candidatus Lokiarchaeota archaeon]